MPDRAERWLAVAMILAALVAALFIGAAAPLL